MMDAETRLSLITGAALEVVGIDHLMARIEDGGTIRAYVGFEPSGKAHVGWKVLATNLRRMLDADVNVLIFLADWHAWVNDKFGSDMEITTDDKFPPLVPDFGKMIVELLEKLCLSRLAFIIAQRCVRRE